MIVPVILSGGTGSRLWPLSRELYPKQLMPLVNEQTMLQNTVDRIENIAGIAAPLVICNDEHRFMVAEQLRGLGVAPGAVILEPLGRNTAPAVTVAALQATAMGADPVLLVLPADHVIADAQGFCRAVEQVAPYAENGHLLTFGIVPTGPETGYGYIKTGESRHGDGVDKVDRFVE
jgi:mannose-1-phosphate guanylyltransferase/mannose-6-phosphate isomerase